MANVKLIEHLHRKRTRFGLHGWLRRSHFQETSQWCRKRRTKKALTFQKPLGDEKHQPDRLTTYGVDRMLLSRSFRGWLPSVSRYRSKDPIPPSAAGRSPVPAPSVVCLVNSQSATCHISHHSLLCPYLRF